MMHPIDAIMCATFEAPATVVAGPVLAAIGCGFAVFIGGQLYLTPAGERYLAERDKVETRSASADAERPERSLNVKFSQHLVGTGATTMAGGIIAIGGDFHLGSIAEEGN